MTVTVTEILVLVAMILSIFIPFRVFLVGERNKTRFRKIISVNSILFFGLLVVGTVIMFAAPTASAAAEEAAETAASSGGISTGLGYLSAALSVGISGVAGGYAVATSSSAALGALSEDSSVFGKALTFVGLAEGVCLYGFIIAMMIVGKL